MNYAAVLFCRYNISPPNELHFGPILVGSKKSQTFVIENDSDKFELKFTISKEKLDMKSAPIPVETAPDKKKYAIIADCLNLI